MMDITEDDVDFLSMGYYLPKRPRPVESFKELNLHENLLRGLYDNKFYAPNKIQRHLLPFLFNNPDKDNVVVNAGCKSGKTSSALIALLNCVSCSDSKSSKALMICPRRDLAKKTFEMGQEMAKYSPFTFHLAVGKDKVTKSNQTIAKRILIGTPEKFDVIITKELFDVNEVEMLVMDDVHVMLRDRSHHDSLFKIFQHFPTCQLIFLSSNESMEIVEKFLESVARRKNALVNVIFPIVQQSLSRVIPHFIFCEDSDMKMWLLKIIVNKRAPYGQVVIICKDKNTATHVCTTIQQQTGFDAGHLIGKMSMGKKEDVIQEFKAGDLKVLVTTPTFTDLNLGNLTTIVNFDHYLLKEGACKLDMNEYYKISDLMKSSGSMFVNFVDSRYESYVLDEKNRPPNIDVINSTELSSALKRNNNIRLQEY